MCLRNFGYAYRLFLVLFVSVHSSPIIIRTGLVKNEGQHQDSNVYDAGHQKGLANFEGEEGFNKGNEQNHVVSENSGKFGQENGVRKDHLDQNNFNKEQFYQNGGGGIADVGNKKAHKKGHHKSGFQNHYHKDEQGSNSSFFDDGADEGDEYVYKTQKGTYGNVGQDRRIGAHLDNVHYANDDAKRGQYDAAQAYEKGRGDNRNYNRKNYYDGRELAGRKNMANNYGEAGRYQEERFVDRPYGHPYHQQLLPPPPHPLPPHNLPPHPIQPHPLPPHPLPPLQKQRITIYEDPRYARRAPYYNQPRYADDYIELDVRPANGYANRGPQDYYY